MSPTRLIRTLDAIRHKKRNQFISGVERSSGLLHRALFLFGKEVPPRLARV